MANTRLLNSLDVFAVETLLVLHIGFSLAMPEVAVPILAPISSQDVIGLYRKNAIAIQKDSGDSNGGKV